MATEITREFRAMNTDILVAIAADEGREAAAADAAGRVESLFAEVEAALTRFRPTSELSALNRAAGKPFRASPLLFEVVRDAIEAARDSAGMFDPTVLGALVAAGYDRSFELLAQLPADLRVAGVTPVFPTARLGWRDVELDPENRTISLPADRGIDLGGIGKGWTVDRAIRILADFPGFAVDAGGDLFARGSQSDGSPWTVGVEDPRDTSRDLAVLTVRDRAVATSSVARRRWVKDGRSLHHLIDPRTGLAASSGVLGATVIAGTVARAEVLAKVALLLGPTEGRAFVDARPDTAALLALDDGSVVRSSRFPEVQRVA